jgi:hypothetical protein
MAISKDFIVKNGIKIQGTGSVASTSTSTGALVVNGGAGFNGDIYAKKMYSNGAEVITTSTLDVFNGIVQSITGGADISVTTSTGDIVISNTSTLETVTGRGASSTHAITISNATASTTSTEGALVVTGGLGVGGSINAGNVYDNANRVLTAVNPTGGTAISISSLSTSSGVVSFTVNNTGVTSLAGSTYLGVSAATGTITLENNGVQSLTAGTETTVTASTGSNIAVNVTSTLQNVTSRGATTDRAISITNTTQSTTSTDGALTVSGGVGIAKNVTVGGTLSVWGPTTFASPVTFNGTATYVNSTNTVYTDNILELHVPPGGVSSQWAGNDGKDIGLRFHYYSTVNSTDTNAALVLAHDTQMLEFYSEGAEDLGGVFTGTTYGGFRTGEIYAENTGNATTSTFGSSGGALQVAGGASIAKDLQIGGALYVGGSQVVTQASQGGSGVGSITAGSGISVSSSTGAITISNTGVLSLTGGTDITVSTSTGNITINDASTLQTVTGRGATSTNAITISNATASSDTTSGALVVTGGVGVGGALNVGGTVYTPTVDAGTNALLLYANGNYIRLNASGTIDIPGSIGSGPYRSNTLDLSVNAVLTATREIGGANGGVILATGTGTVATNFWQFGYTGDLTAPGNITAPTVSVTATTAATTVTSGALQVSGGTGIDGSLYARDIYSNGIRVATTDMVSGTRVTSIVAGTDISITTSTGAVTINDTSTLQSVTGRGATTTNAVSITNATESTGTATGALTVVGGVGVGGDVNVGGAISVGSAAQASAFTSISTNTAALLSLDSYSATSYRTAKYVVQVVDGTLVQATELLVFHNGTDAYIIQYGIGYSDSEMGTWDADLTGGIVTLQFTPNYNPTALTVKTMRTAITA